MRLLLVGCEYSGVRTLAKAIVESAKHEMDAFAGIPDEYLVHDHFMVPHISHPPELTDDEHDQIMALSPRVKEMVQRHNIYYHIPFTAQGGDSLLVGLHIEDNVYGPLYFGYLVDLDPDDPIMVTRGMFEEWIVRSAPETVLVLVKASPDVIRGRMAARPHTRPVLRYEDVDQVLRRFEEEFEGSTLLNKMAIDTSAATVHESLEEFARKIEPFLTEDDHRRMAERAAGGG